MSLRGAEKIRAQKSTFRRGHFLNRTSGKSRSFKKLSASVQVSHKLLEKIRTGERALRKNAVFKDARKNCFRRLTDDETAVPEISLGKDTFQKIYSLKIRFCKKRSWKNRTFQKRHFLKRAFSNSICETSSSLRVSSRKRRFYPLFLRPCLSDFFLSAYRHSARLSNVRNYPALKVYYIPARKVNDFRERRFFIQKTTTF